MKKNKFTKLTKETIVNAIKKYRKLYMSGEIDPKNESIIYDLYYQDIFA